MGADNQQLGHEVPFFIVSECPTPQLCAGSDRRRQGPKTLTVAADGADRPLHPVQDWPVMGILATVVNVFVDEAGEHGNPLGIVWASTATRGHEQDIAADLGFSETVFIDEVDGRTVRARIFTPKQELRFAGHPTVGLAAWLRAAGDDIRHVVVPAGSDINEQVGVGSRGRMNASPLGGVCTGERWMPFEFSPRVAPKLHVHS